MLSLLRVVHDFLCSPAQFPAALQGSSPNHVSNKEQLQKKQIVQPSFIDGKQLMCSTLKLGSVVEKYF